MCPSPVNTDNTKKAIILPIKKAMDERTRQVMLSLVVPVKNASGRLLGKFQEGQQRLYRMEIHCQYGR
jgi:hypothetical protein